MFFRAAQPCEIEVEEEKRLLRYYLQLKALTAPTVQAQPNNALLEIRDKVNQCFWRLYKTRDKFREKAEDIFHDHPVDSQKFSSIIHQFFDAKTDEKSWRALASDYLYLILKLLCILRCENLLDALLQQRAAVMNEFLTDKQFYKLACQAARYQHENFIIYLSQQNRSMNEWAVLYHSIGTLIVTPFAAAYYGAIFGKNIPESQFEKAKSIMLHLLQIGVDPHKYYLWDNLSNEELFYKVESGAGANIFQEAEEILNFFASNAFKESTASIQIPPEYVEFLRFVVKLGQDTDLQQSINLRP